jgi:protein tyrosine/serine phosphatase
MARPRQISPSLVLLIIAAGFAGCGSRNNTSPTAKEIAQQERLSVPGINDFGKINNFLYRGAQPKPEGLDELKELGINVIVDLRGERPGLRKTEKEHAESLGMTLVSLPGYGWASPKDEEVAQFFALLRETPRKIIFIHCWLGGDRDGMLVAAYRIAFDGWTADHALQEMRAFHYKEFWHPNMRTWVRDFPERLAKSPALAPYRNVARLAEKTSATPASTQP